MLVTRKIDACNTSHKSPNPSSLLSAATSFEPRATSNQFWLAAHSSKRVASSPLALFVFRVFADHPHYSLAVDDLALVANLLYRRSYFHNSSCSAGVLAGCPAGVSPAVPHNAICSGTRFARDSDRREKVRPRLCLPAVSV